jgi:hypothetical protein
LRNAPVVGELAMATEKAAGAIGSIASYFGYTNVPNIEDVKPFKQMPFQLSTAHISEPVNKLSLQPKQETAIGSVQHGGMPRDDLSITNFIGRSSFVVGGDWLTTNAPGTPLFTTWVNPAMFQRSATQIAHTPMSYVGQNFQYWRGSIRYTIKMIRSPYHRGRVQVSGIA